MRLIFQKRYFTWSSVALSKHVIHYDQQLGFKY
jgi:hypothetical protein